MRELSRPRRIALLLCMVLLMVTAASLLRSRGVSMAASISIGFLFTALHLVLMNWVSRRLAGFQNRRIPR